METKSPIREEGTIGLAAWTGESRGMISAHRHLDLEINYILSGNMRYFAGGRIVDLPPRRLCLLWGGIPHQMVRNRQPAEAIWVTIPLAFVLRWGLPDRLIRPLLVAGVVADPAPRAGDLDLLNQWLIDLPGLGVPHPHGVGEKTNDAAGIVLLEIEARLRRFAHSLPPPEKEPGTKTPGADRGEQEERAAHSDRGLAAVEAMTQFITQNFPDAITIADIAARAHLHPNYAMTLFRHHTGMTLSQYLVLQRIAQAQRLLATTSISLERIAFDSGFGSVSRFYEAFRQQTGNSPRRFRLHLGQKNLPELPVIPSE